MKARQEHRIPLSRAALAILENAKHYRDTTGLGIPRRAVRDDDC